MCNMFRRTVSRYMVVSHCHSLFASSSILLDVLLTESCYQVAKKSECHSGNGEGFHGTHKALCRNGLP